MPLASAALLAALALLLGDPPPGEPIVIVRTELASGSEKVEVRVHPPAGSFEGTLGDPVTSDLGFGKASGNKPVRFVLAADPMKDGYDALLKLQEKANKASHDLKVKVHLPPLFVDTDVGSSLASSKKNALGGMTGEEAVLQVSAGDHDGDGRDEAFVLRLHPSGTQQLEVRKLPKNSKSSMKLLASDETFGVPGIDEAISLCGADVDGDGDDEVVVLFRPQGEPDEIRVYEPPTDIAGETGAPFAFDLDVTPSDGATNLSVGRLDFDGDGADELAILRRGLFSGTRLDVVAPPQIPDGELGPLLFSATDLAPLGAPYAVTAAFGLRGWTANPPDLPDDLGGSYSAEMSHLADGVPGKVLGLGSLQAHMAGGSNFVIAFPVFKQLVGAYDPEKGSVDFSAQLAQIDEPGTGHTYFLDLGVAQVSLQDGDVVLTGTYIGVKNVGFGQQQQITAGSYEFRRQ